MSEFFLCHQRVIVSIGCTLVWGVPAPRVELGGVEIDITIPLPNKKIFQILRRGGSKKLKNWGGVFSQVLVLTIGSRKDLYKFPKSLSLCMPK